MPRCASLNSFAGLQLNSLCYFIEGPILLHSCLYLFTGAFVNYLECRWNEVKYWFTIIVIGNLSATCDVVMIGFNSIWVSSGAN
jgi:hypothetical protein